MDLGGRTYLVQRRLSMNTLVSVDERRPSGNTPLIMRIFRSWSPFAISMEYMSLSIRFLIIATGLSYLWEPVWGTLLYRFRSLRFQMTTIPCRDLLSTRHKTWMEIEQRRKQCEIESEKQSSHLQIRWRFWPRLETRPSKASQDHLIARYVTLHWRQNKNDNATVFR